MIHFVIFPLSLQQLDAGISWTHSRLQCCSNVKICTNSKHETHRSDMCLMWGHWVRENERESYCRLPRILSAISTVFGSSLSPPVFGCHDDDVKLHHRFSPVDGFWGGATKSRTIACRSHRPVTLLCSDSRLLLDHPLTHLSKMREIVHLQAGQCGNQIGAKVFLSDFLFYFSDLQSVRCAPAVMRALLGGARRSPLIHPPGILKAYCVAKRTKSIHRRFAHWYSVQSFHPGQDSCMLVSARKIKIHATQKRYFASIIACKIGF